MQISAIACQGLNQAQAQVEKAGGQIASLADSSQNPAADTADLSNAAVALLSGKDAFAADLKLVKTADEMQKQAVNLLG